MKGHFSYDTLFPENFIDSPMSIIRKRIFFFKGRKKKDSSKFVNVEVFILLGIFLSINGSGYHQTISTLYKNYGEFFSFRIFFRRIIIVSRIDYVEHILSKRQIYDVSYITMKNFSLLFPEGLLALKGDKWKRHARIMLPVFRKGQIICHIDTISSTIDHFIEKNILNENNKIHKNLVKQSQDLLLRVISRIAFNYDFGNLSKIEGENVHNAFSSMVKCASKFDLMIIIPLWVSKLVLFFNFKFQNSLKIMKHYVTIIINDQLKRQENETNIFDNKKKSLINSLIESSQSEKDNSLNFNEIFDEISMSILAGYETTSTALSWFIYYMSKYPNVQQKIKHELKEYCLTSDIQLTQQILEQLIYVDCVLKEVLRFAPIAPGIVRQATSDDIIDGYKINKGDIFLIATHNLHLNSKYWNIDPNEFYPERFLDQDKSPPKYSYMPFGGGHRACIGQDLALLEFKIAIIRFMQRITFEDPGSEADNSGGFIQHITCFPKNLAVRIIIDSHNTH